MPASGQHPVPRGAQAQPGLPAGGNLRSRLQSETVGAPLVEAITPDLCVLQVQIRREPGATQRQAITAFAIGNAVTAIAGAFDTAVLVAQLQLPAHEIGRASCRERVCQSV